MPEPQLKEITVKEVWPYGKSLFIRDPEDTVYQISDDNLKPLAKAGNHFEAWCEEPTPPKKSWKILYQEKPEEQQAPPSTAHYQPAKVESASREKDIHRQVALKCAISLAENDKIPVMKVISYATVFEAWLNGDFEIDPKIVMDFVDKYLKKQGVE